MAKDSNKNEYVQCCKRLIGAGADLNHRDHLGRTSLHWAVFYNKPDLVSELLDCGSDPKIRDDGGQNVLHFAIRVHAVECIQVLCDQVENEVLRESNNKGVPPIIYAVQQGHADSCEILLKAGVDINEIEDNNVSKTALHYSVEFNRLDLVQFLLSHEARVDIADASKLTVVDLSCICDDYHYLATIIDHLGDERR
uniref:Neurogenic locus Notch protein-like n=1 Tax=Saccoglossus kowalevskii TaxID=10224 RepID=A0ABM0LWR1_SACKO|nr:PREDICTED: neurogenic locus Notch protein-like [Saccoglossus kowalevskii]